MAILIRLVTKKFLITLVCLFIAGFDFAAIAGTFMGLEPGTSKKSNADKALGRPKLEVIKDIRYDYAPKNSDIRRISIKFHKNTKLIESIDIYPRQPLKKEQYKVLLGLRELQKAKRDADGNLIEYFISDGIALHFAGPLDSSPVEFCSHFDPAPLVQGKKVRKDLKSKEKPPRKGKVAKRPPRRDEAYYTEAADGATKREDWKSVKQIVDEGLRLYPASARLWNSRAFYYFHCKSEPDDKRLRETLRSAQRAYALDPKTLNALNLGWIYLEMYQDYQSAISYFEKIEREHAQKDPALYYWMATCYEQTRRPRKAVAYYSRFLDLAPNNIKAPDAQRRLEMLLPRKQR